MKKPQRKDARIESVEKSAKGVTGFILSTFGDKLVFRVYQKNGKFKDYDLLHLDLEVKIQGSDAVLRTYKNGRQTLDYSRAVLGLPKGKKK